MKRRILFLVSLLSVVLGSGMLKTAQAEDLIVDDQQQQSIATNLGLYGGSVWDMAQDPITDTLYAVANNTPNGFFYSTDDGDNWVGVPAGSDYSTSLSVEVDPATGIVFVAFANALYRSIDQGVTLQKISDTSAGVLLYANDRLFEITEGATLNISTDNGVSFDVVNIADNFAAWNMAYSSADAALYVVGNNTDETNPIVYRSTDNGATWSLLYTFADISDTSSSEELAVNPTNPLHLVLAGGFDYLARQSFDGGATWSEIADIYAINTTFDTTGRAYLGSYYSDDTGVTWTAFPTEHLRLPEHNLMIDIFDIDVLYGDGQVGILKSTDRGVTWTAKNLGITGVMVTDIVQATDKDIVWTASYNGYAKTENFTDSAPTWQFPMLGEAGVSVWLDPATPNTVLAGGICFLYKTTDGGTTWSDNILFGTVSCDEQVSDIIADPNDNTILYAAVANNNPNRDKHGLVLKSTDQGETWTDLVVPDDLSVQTLIMNQSGDLFAGIGASGGTAIGGVGIYKYSAATWTQLSGAPSEEIRKLLLDPTNDQIMYALGGGSVGAYKTTDGGTTWTELTAALDLSNFYALTLQNTSTLYLAGSDSNSKAVIYKSTDAGATWGLYYTGLTGEQYYSLLFDGLTAGNDRGIYLLQSKPAMTLRANQHRKPTLTVPTDSRVTLRTKLSDASTGRVLKHQSVRLYRKLSSNHWKLIDSARTSITGRVSWHKPVTALTKFKVRWTPSAQKAEEYAAGLSRVVTVRVE
ncbi:MAG: hypothetical protein WCV88_03980 [Patescibacteria group bacterium]|jgi:photosystem II stability/assembly factor-like uncharacterized protein